MNVSDRLEERLAGDRLAVLRSISRHATPLGVDVYLVGGSVRDVLSDESPFDIDVMASGDIERLVDSVVGEGAAIVRKASAFGTWSLTAMGIALDLSTARRETYERPGALPTVLPGTVEDDLGRRDFSINAMAISLCEDSWGDLLDLHDGVRDLKEGLVRVLHDRSFEDDATRILRAIRYVCRGDVQLEQRTEALLECALPFLDAISPDRVRHEFERIFQEPGTADMVAMAGRMGVLAAVHPALGADAASLRAIQDMPHDDTRRAELLLGSMVQSITEGDVQSVVKRLNLNAEWARIVRDTATLRGRLRDLAGENVSRSGVYQLLSGIQTSAIESRATATSNQTVALRLRLYLEELRHVRPTLNGDDLMSMGVPEGPSVGEILGKLLEARLDGLVATVEDEKRMVRRLHRGDCEK